MGARAPVPKRPPPREGKRGKGRSLPWCLSAVSSWGRSWGLCDSFLPMSGGIRGASESSHRRLVLRFPVPFPSVLSDPPRGTSAEAFVLPVRPFPCSSFPCSSLQCGRGRHTHTHTIPRVSRVCAHLECLDRLLSDTDRHSSAPSCLGSSLQLLFTSASPRPVRMLKLGMSAWSARVGSSRAVS